MINYFFILLSAILLLFSIIDIILHEKNKYKRGKRGIVFLCCLFFLCVLTGYYGVTNALALQVDNASHKYLAMKYLEAGNADQAKKYIKILPNEGSRDNYEKTVLGMIADGMKGDYSSAIENARFFTSTANATVSRQDKINKMADIYGKLDGAQANTAEYDLIKIDENGIVAGTINEMLEGLNIADDVRRTYDDIYTIDEAITNNQFDSNTEEIAAQLTKSKSEDARKAVIKYYFAKGDLAAAEESAKVLVKKHPTVNNKIIFTDIVAQRVRNAVTNQDYGSTSQDTEAVKLNSQANELQNKASQYDSLIYNETDQKKRTSYESKRGSLLNRAAELRKQTQLIPVKRAINYLVDSKPLLGDNTGLLDMQIAKLYFTADEIEKSREYIRKVLNSKANIAPDSIIRNDIDDIKDAMSSTSGSEIPSEALYSTSVDSIVNKMSQNIVPAEQSTINEEFKNSVVSELKYNNLQLFISKVDYSGYPNIKAHVNLSGQKNGLFGLANEYESKDFILADTDYRINSFKMAKNSANNGASIAMVLDHSGSMQGRPFEDAKLAVLSCIDNKNGRDSFSVITYSDNASIVSGMNSDSGMLKSSTNMIDSPNGNTNISDGLFKALETLSQAGGVRAVILLSDGLDNRSEEGSLDKIIQYAKTNNISIFTVGLGEVDANYMGNIAQQTGGAFFKAVNTTQLYDIYRLLQKYIRNNYIFEYTISKNKDTKLRKCEVLLADKGVYDSKVYSLGGEGSVDEESYDALYQNPDSLWIEQISPSSMAISKVGKNTRIRITGKNFDRNMKVMIGNYYSRDVKVLNGSEAEILLPEALTPGFYTVSLENPDGNTRTRNNGFTLFRPGIAKKLKVGSVTIEANTIGQTDSTSFVASGNVVINGFLRSSSDLFISANAPTQLDFSNEEVIDLAATGVIKGDGKLFASYSANKEDGTKNNFAAIALSGKDYIVKSGKYAINANDLDASFENNENSVFSLKLPGIIDLTVGQTKIMSDGLEIKAYEGENLTLIKALSEALKGTKTDESDTAVLGKSKQKTSFSMDELSFKITKEDILAKVSVEVKNPIKLPSVKATSLKLVIDNMSGDEWISVKGGFELDVNAPKFSGLEMELASYHLSLNKIEIMTQLGTGIALDPYQVIRLFQIGGGVDNIANASKGIEVYLKAEAGIKVSSLLQINEDDVPEILSKLDKLVMLSNMELRVQPVSKLAVSSELKVFDTKMMEVEMSVSKEGYKALGKVELGVDFLGITIDMDGTDQIEINKNGLYKTISGNIRKVEMPFLDINNESGFVSFSIANLQLMLEAGNNNVYRKAVFDLNKGIWGLIPEVSCSIN